MIDALSIKQLKCNIVTVEELISAIAATESLAKMIRNGSAPSTPLFNTNTFHVVFSLLTGLCCFIPLCMGVTSNLEIRPLRDALQKGSGFTYSCIAAMALVIPLLVDLLIDIGYEIATVVVKPSGKITARFNFLNKYERTLFLLGIAVLPLLIFVPKNTPDLALIYVCCNKCQQNWIGGTVALSLCRYDKHYFSDKSTWISLTLFAISMIGSTFVDNLYAIKPPAQHIALLDMGTFILSGIPCVLFLFNSSRWLILAHYRAIQWTNILFFYSKSRQIHPSAMTNTSANSDHTFFPMIYTLIGMIVLVLLSVLIATSSRIENYNETNLVQGNIPFLVFVVSVSILSMRMVKFEVIQGLYALIESKKSYVRYISHELRTPLNAAFLGLKLLTDDLKSSASQRDSERIEILADVNTACRTTLDILNDLLCFDKMESGILEVHKHMVPVVPFLSDCVSIFAAQAREGCVAMSIITGPVEHDDPTDSVSRLPLLEDDTVFIDRFKMDQVIRNLVSNALKFTPPGGSVTLTAYFEADAVVRLSQQSRDSIRPLKAVCSAGLTRFLAPYFSRCPHFRTRETCRVSPAFDIERGGSALMSSEPEEVKMIKGKLVIVVKDTGAGMLPEDYSRLFKEIVQFKPEVLQAGGGSGLGLWITKGIVDLHGGTVKVHSEGLGLGSSFVVELFMERKAVQDSPIAAAFILESPKIPIPPNPTFLDSADFEKSADRLHLLIVDDSFLNRKMLLRTFRAAGHECDEAVDGLEAVEKIKDIMASPQGSYSVVLMDFVMPNMDGPTATKEIRALGYTAPIFGVTGNTLNSDVDYFLLKGADKVLAKPLNVDMFNDAVVGLSDSQRSFADANFN